MQPIDLDDLATWPCEIRAEAGQLWASVQALISCYPPQVGELAEVGMNTSKLDSLLAPHELLVFHATRLLPHENGRLLDSGLQPASESLLRVRLAEAAAHDDVLDEDVIEELVAGSPLQHQPQRAGRVHFVHSRSFIAAASEGFVEFFGRWGGEVGYWYSGEGVNTQRCEAALERLREQSTPTLVVGRVRPGSVRVGYGWSTVLVGALSGAVGDPWMRAFGTVDVERLIQPGDPDWDPAWNPEP